MLCPECQGNPRWVRPRWIQFNGVGWVERAVCSVCHGEGQVSDIVGQLYFARKLPLPPIETRTLRQRRFNRKEAKQAKGVVNE